jgi:hypothetical protein
VIEFQCRFRSGVGFPDAGEECRALLQVNGDPVLKSGDGGELRLDELLG